MTTRSGFAIQSLLITVIINAIMLGAIYFVAGAAIQAANQMLPFLAIGIVGTIILWLAISFASSRLVSNAVAEPELVSAGARSTAPVTTAAPTPASPVTPAPSMRERVRPQAPAATAADGAVQMLAILQREGRLVDFLQEEISMYEDGQIGAAVRNIHAGCRHALAEHVKLEPVYQEAEGSNVGVPAGFDTHAVRLTGDVVGEPPFKGALRHRGWRVARIDLPEQSIEQNRTMIVAPAEVEVNA